MEIARFQDQLIKRLTEDMSMQLETSSSGNSHHGQPSMGAVMIPPQYPYETEWTFARAFLYSLTVLTTIGEFTIFFFFTHSYILIAVCVLHKLQYMQCGLRVEACCRYAIIIFLL